MSEQPHKKMTTLYWWPDAQLQRAGWQSISAVSLASDSVFVRVWRHSSGRCLLEETDDDGNRGAWYEEPPPPTRLTTSEVSARICSLSQGTPTGTDRRWAVRVLRVLWDFAYKTQGDREIRENMDRIHEAFWTEPEDG